MGNPRNMMRPMPGHAEVIRPKIIQFDRSLGVWDFEDGSYVAIVVGGDIATAEVLDMVDTLVGLKRAELAAERDAAPLPQMPHDTRDE